MIEFDEEWSGPWIAANPRPVTSDGGVQDQRGDGDAADAADEDSDASALSDQ